jgi:iron complex transport system permease protein
MTERRRQVVGLLALGALALAMCVLRLLIYRFPGGGIHFGWPDASVAEFRWTALGNGVIVGGSLAIAGVLLQALLRNPLAEPFILGISSGAGLAVMAAMYAAHLAGATTAIGGARTVPAIVGATLTLALVYALGQKRGWLDPITLVLIGVIISAMCGAGIMFFQHAVPTGLHQEFTLWLMGYIPEKSSAATMTVNGVIAFGGLWIGIFMGSAMDAATLGDDEARSVGLSVGPLRVMMFLLAGVLAAATVAVAGPIGFVGLIAPHAARLVLGPRHTPLVLGAALAGIVLVVGSDVARQAITLGGGRMPVGIFTAFIGGPAFIWLLLSGKGQA